jgi:hypothetical protein
MSEDELREIEARLDREAMTVPTPGEPPLRTQIVSVDAPAMLVEIRRIQALFPDPEADAAAIEFMIREDWPEDTSPWPEVVRARDVARRIRQIAPTDTGESADG